jgi:hypothetical protein
MTGRTAPAARGTTGLSGLRITREDAATPLFRKLVAALSEERELAREHLEHPMNIEQTTLLRGRVQLVKEILARTDEVGPESRQAEPNFWPEPAVPPGS